MATNHWEKSGGCWYYLKSSGAMANSETLTVNGKSYNFDQIGKCTNP